MGTVILASPAVAFILRRRPMTNFSNLSVGGVPILAGRNPFGRVLFVDGNLGADGSTGRASGRSYKTMAKAMANVQSGDTIYLRGNITENITAPAGVFDVTIIGATSRPRHADGHTGNNGYSSATWKASSQTDPLLILRQQGWVLQNILFDCPTSDAAIDFVRDAASGDSERDSGHAAILGCRFASGQEAIRITGTENIFNVLVQGNTFNDLTHAIVSSGGYAYRWQIRDNEFVANTNHIDVGFTQSTIRDNNFGKFTTKAIDLTGGANNVVTRNHLSGTYSNVGGYTAGTDDEWGGNYNSLSGGVTASDPA
jgi:hypothetical protein